MLAISTRRSSPAETWLVAYTHRDDGAHDPACFYGEPAVGQTLAQAMSDVRDKLAGGYAVDFVIRWDHVADVGACETKRVAQAFADKLTDWHDSPEADAIDDFCAGELGFSPLRQSWREADRPPVSGSINGRAQHGATGPLYCLPFGGWLAVALPCFGVLFGMGG